MLSRRDLLFGRPASVDTMLSSEEGATAIEYGLLVGLIGVVSIGTLSRLGKRQRRNLNCINRALRGRAQSRFCERRTA